MATITEDYVSFETAKLLKDKGFPQSTFRCHYIIDGNIHYKSFKNRCGFGDYDIIAPTLQMAMKWLREVHNVAIVISPSMFWGKYNISIYKKGNDYPFGFDGDSLIPFYEQACEVAIKYCLEHLI